MHKLLFDLTSPAQYVSGGWFNSSGSWKHPQRTLESYVLIVGVQGNAYIKVSAQNYTVCSGDALILPPNIQHSGYQESHDVSYLWFHFTAKVNANNSNNSIILPMFIHSHSHSRLLQLGVQLLHIEQAKYSNTLSVNYQLSSILLEIAEQYHYSSTIKQQDHPRKIYEIQEWIRINAKQPLTLSQVAEHFHYNKNYLCKIFKKETGHTVQNHITSCKLEIVKQALLTKNTPIKQLTKMINFSDEKYLMRVFRQYEGVTLSKFKNAYCRVHYNKS